MIRLPILVLFAFVFVLGNTGAASAAPQILAALPMGEPYQLACHDGKCAAEFSAICLQPQRSAPASYTPYHVRAEDMGHLKLTGLTANGTVVSLPAAILKIESLRSQTSIRFFLNEEVLEQRHLKSISVGLYRMIALLPAEEEGDTAPQTKGDITSASSGIDRFGKAWAEINVDNMTIARIAARIGNELPKAGNVAKEQSDKLMELAVEHEPKLTTGSLGSARQLVTNCQLRSRFMPMRRCLEEYHDQIMLGLNGKYWSALKPGS